MKSQSQPSVPLSRNTLSQWLSLILSQQSPRVEDLGNGVVYCRLLHHYHPNSVQLNRICMCPKNQYDNIGNLKLFQAALGRLGMDSVQFDINKVAKMKFTENWNIITVMYKLLTTTNIGITKDGTTKDGITNNGIKKDGTTNNDITKDGITNNGSKTLDSSKVTLTHNNLSNSNISHSQSQLNCCDPLNSVHNIHSQQSMYPSMDTTTNKRHSSQSLLDRGLPQKRRQLDEDSSSLNMGKITPINMINMINMASNNSKIGLVRVNRLMNNSSVVRTPLKPTNTLLGSQSTNRVMSINQQSIKVNKACTPYKLVAQIISSQQSSIGGHNNRLSQSCVRSVGGVSSFITNNNGIITNNNGTKNHINGTTNHTYGTTNHNNGTTNHINGTKNHNHQSGSTTNYQPNVVPFSTCPSPFGDYVLPSQLSITNNSNPNGTYHSNNNHNPNGTYLNNNHNPNSTYNTQSTHTNPYNMIIVPSYTPTRWPISPQSFFQSNEWAFIDKVKQIVLKDAHNTQKVRQVKLLLGISTQNDQYHIVKEEVQDHNPVRIVSSGGEMQGIGSNNHNGYITANSNSNNSNIGCSIPKYDGQASSSLSTESSMSYYYNGTTNHCLVSHINNPHNKLINNKNVSHSKLL